MPEPGIGHPSVAADNQNLYVSGGSAMSWALLRVSLDGKLKRLREVPMGQAWLTRPIPSPDGRYLAYLVRTFETNVVMLENF
jgi:hypothetical protein